MTMKISEAGLALISSFEGLRLAAYLDPVRIPTIGWGHTGPDVRLGMTITQARAVELLREDTSAAAADVNRLVFNAGTAPLSPGTLGRKLNAGDVAGAAAEFGRWVKGKDKSGQFVTLAGLVRRRAAEEAMFKGSAAAAQSPASVLNRNEKDWVTRYDALVDGGKGSSPQAKALQEQMRRQRKTIWRLAQPAANGGDGNGWHFRHRVERYRMLVARRT
jgi:lysozyme